MRLNLFQPIKIKTFLMIVVGITLGGPLLSLGSEQKVQSDSSSMVTLSSESVANGRVTLLEIDTRKLDLTDADLEANFRGHSIAIFRHPIKPRGIYCGLVAIPLHTSTGHATVTLVWTDLNGPQTATIALQIIDGQYRSEALSVNARHITLSQEDLERVKHEKKEIRRVYASSNSARLWRGFFKTPLDSDITSPFGTRRLFNGQLRSYHRGVDFRANVGKPVYAANSGIVKLADNLFYSGNIIIVDHGRGIFTNYAHLSKIGVSAGQRIEKGQRIGSSGATGRVNGPHLHWGVKVNGIYVDPLQFVKVISYLLEQNI